MMRKRTPGFTIIEVLVFSSISLLVLVVLTKLFITATKRTEDARLRVDLQQRGLLVLRQFEKDFSLASTRGLAATVSGPNYVLGMTPIEPRSPGNWKTMQILYVHNSEDKELFWREALEDDFAEDLYPSKPYLPGPPELLSLSAGSTGKSRILSGNVEDFSLSDRNGSKTQFQAQPFVLDMKLRRPLSHSDRFAEFTVQKRFTLRNNY
jgi:type II secretory pathway pseudopilin PulG